MSGCTYITHICIKDMVQRISLCMFVQFSNKIYAFQNFIFDSLSESGRMYNSKTQLCSKRGITTKTILWLSTHRAIFYFNFIGIGIYSDIAILSIERFILCIAFLTHKLTFDVLHVYVHTMRNIIIHIAIRKHAILYI